MSAGGSHPKHNLAFNVLFADDTLDLEEKESDEDITAKTSYGNWYAWATHKYFPNPKLGVRTILAYSHIDQDRDAFGIDHEDSFTIRDIRDTDVLTFKQDWSYDLSRRHAFEWGFEARQYDTEYDYQSTVDIERSIPDPRFREPMGEVDYKAAFEGDYQGAYLSHRFQATDNLSTEIGARFDRSTLTDESHVGPALQLALDARRAQCLQLGLGPCLPEPPDARARRAGRRDGFL